MSEMVSNVLLRTEQVSCHLCGSDNGKAVASGYDLEYRSAAGEVTMLRCQSCGLYYLSPRPIAEELERIYPPTYHAYCTEERSRLMRKMHNFQLTSAAKSFLETAGLAIKRKTTNVSVLDIGCGDGDLLRAMRSVDELLDLWGGEMDVSAAERARADGFSVVIGRFEMVQLPPETFDLILCRQLIEHLEEPKTFLERAQVLLRTGGVFIVETVNADTIKRRIFGRYWGGYCFPRHWYLFT